MIQVVTDRRGEWIVDSTALYSRRPGFRSRPRDGVFGDFLESPLADIAIASFHVLFNSLFTNHRAIRRYVF
jgi:hypothetical protein